MIEDLGVLKRETLSALYVGALVLVYADVGLRNSHPKSGSRVGLYRSAGEIFVGKRLTASNQLATVLSVVQDTGYLPVLLVAVGGQVGWVLASNVVGIEQ